MIFSEKKASAAAVYTTNLVKGAPEERRSFLNIAISQCEPLYIRYYQGYKKALENRINRKARTDQGLLMDRPAGCGNTMQC